MGFYEIKATHFPLDHADIKKNVITRSLQSQVCHILLVDKMQTCKSVLVPGIALPVF